MQGRHTSGHTGEGRRGNPQNLVPQFAEVAHALVGIDLPQDKQGLLDFVNGKKADTEVINIIQAMPDAQFETMADIMAAVGKVEKGDKGGRTTH